MFKHHRVWRYNLRLILLISQKWHGLTCGVFLPAITVSIYGVLEEALRGQKDSPEYVSVQNVKRPNGLYSWESHFSLWGLNQGICNFRVAHLCILMGRQDDAKSYPCSKCCSGMTNVTTPVKWRDSRFVTSWRKHSSVHIHNLVFSVIPQRNVRQKNKMRKAKGQAHIIQFKTFRVVPMSKMSWMSFERSDIWSVLVLNIKLFMIQNLRRPSILLQDSVYKINIIY